MKIGFKDEVFLTRLHIAERSVWLAWVASSSGSDFFLAENRALLWSGKDADIRSYLEGKGISIENETSYFDVDSLLCGLKFGSIVSPDLAINVWNIFTDFYNTFHNGSAAKFCEDRDLDGLYDRLFSLCGAAKIIDLDASRLTDEDINLLSEIVEMGVAMIGAHINDGESGVPRR